MCFCQHVLEEHHKNLIKTLFSTVPVRCNGHLQGGLSVGSAVGSASRTNGECRGPGRKSEAASAADLFSEMNMTEIQKLKQQLMTVSLEEGLRGAEEVPLCQHQPAFTREVGCRMASTWLPGSRCFCQHLISDVGEMLLKIYEAQTI